MNWYEKRVKELGYEGCKNCKHQIGVLRTCEWMEHDGGDGVLHLICPKWEKRMDEKGKRKMDKHDADGFIVDVSKPVVHIGQDPKIEIRNDGEDKIDRDFFCDGQMMAAIVRQGKIILFPFPECRLCKHRTMPGDCGNMHTYCEYYGMITNLEIGCTHFDLMESRKSK